MLVRFIPHHQRTTRILNREDASIPPHTGPEGDPPMFSLPIFKKHFLTKNRKIRYEFNMGLNQGSWKWSLGWMEGTKKCHGGNVVYFPFFSLVRGAEAPTPSPPPHAIPGGMDRINVFISNHQNTFPRIHGKKGGGEKRAPWAPPD